MFSSWPARGECYRADGADISDGNIRYFEYENDSLHFLNEYKSSDPRGSFVTVCEI